MLKVVLISHTPNPEKIVAAAAKLCYSSAGVEDVLEGLDVERSRGFIGMLGSVGHESPMEHAVFTFGIEGVSRALLAQITRHRIAAFSVQSQRYVGMDDFEFVIPPDIEADPAAANLFRAEMEHDAARYSELATALEAKHFERLAAAGVPEGQARYKAEKLAAEDARFLLPNACTTKMLVTMNARSLNNFFRLRCCNRAQWEIRRLAEEMLRLVLQVAPALFAKAGPGCADDGCTEGKMTCGDAKAVKAKYEAIRTGAHAPGGGQA